MQRTNPTAPRRSRGALARRLALGLSLALVAGAFALPALADSDTTSDPEIISPEKDTTIRSGVLQLAATATPNTSINFAVRKTKDNDDSCDTKTDLDGLARDISRELKTNDEGIWTKSVPVSEAEEGLYCFAFDPSDGERISVKFNLDFEPDLEGFDEKDIDECFTDDEPDCTNELKIGDVNNSQDFTASTETQAKSNQTALIGFREAVEGELDEAAGEACDAALATNGNRNQRFGPNLVQLVPIGFLDGNITVTSIIPADFVNEQSATGAGLFQVCVVPDKSDYGDYKELPNLEPGLYGPILLESCPDPDATPCIESRTKDEDGRVILTYRIPTQDPFLQ